MRIVFYTLYNYTGTKLGVSSNNKFNTRFNLTSFLSYGIIKRRGACFRANFAAAMSVSKGTNAGQAGVRKTLHAE